MFDEIERVSPGTASSAHWRSHDDFIYFWQALRAFYQRHPEVFTYFLVGTNPFCIESSVFNGHENPIFKSIPSTYMPPFELAQVREMVRKLGRYMGMKFDENVYGLLHNDFGGHPFLIRQICSELHRSAHGDRPVTIDKPLYQKVKNDFADKTIEYLEMMVQVLRDWYPDEYEVLTFLATDDQESFATFAKENPEYTRHLVGYGLLQQSQHGFAFSIELAKEYLLNRHKYERIHMSDEDKLLEISGRRNRIEQGLRQMIRTLLKALLGKDKASSVVLAAIPESRRSQLGSNEIESLLSKDNSPLYFIDLVNLIKREWEKLGKVFEKPKDRVIFILEEINEIGRPDAHARFVKDEEFAQVRRHFSFLEGVLKDWI